MRFQREFFHFSVNNSLQSYASAAPKCSFELYYGRALAGMLTDRFAQIGGQVMADFVFAHF